MDNNLKKKQDAEADNRRLEIFRKARKDADRDARAENEDNYQKRVDNMDKKPKKKEVILDEEDDFLKGLKTYGEDFN